MLKYLSLIIILFNTFIFAKSNIEKYGDITQILIPTSAYLSTIYLDDKDGKNQFYKSFAGNFLLTHILKRTVREKRPNNTNNYSFPSGHTSASFQGATFIHKRYGLKYSIIPYIGASFVAYSRVHAKQHYTHDVIAGAIIGSSFSWYFTKKYKYKNVSISPIVFNSINSDTTLYGVSLKW